MVVSYAEDAARLAAIPLTVAQRTPICALGDPPRP